MLLGDVLLPISRPEPVVATQQYRLLGAHWYAEGLYIKDIKAGSEIQANQLYRVEAGDFVYNRLFAWKGSFALAGKNVHGCHVSNEFPCFRLREERVDGRYLHYYFSRESIWNEALGLSSGGTPTSRNRLKEVHLLAMTVPLPPLAEQRRIVEKVERLRRLHGSLVEDRNRAATEIASLRHSAVDGLFAEPGNHTVGDYANLQSGYAFKSHWFSEEGVRLVRNVNIGHGAIEWGAIAKLPWNQAGEFERFSVALGDILISLDRPIISTGVKVARVREADLPCLLLQRVGRVCFSTDDVLPDYFYAWLQSGHFARALDPGRSNGVPHISPKDVEKIPFLAPTLVEQERVVSTIQGLTHKLHRLDQLQSSVSLQVEALIPSVLNQAFSGQL